MRFLRQVGTVLSLLFGILGLLTILSVRIPVHSGPAPVAVSNGDVDCDGALTITDPIRMLNYLFSDGPAPCAIAQGDPSCCEALTAILERVLAPNGNALRASTVPCGEIDRYFDNGDGTATDTCTGLMWQSEFTSADVNLDGIPDSLFNFPQAVQVAESNELAGHSDWRIPTAGEAETLLRFLAEKPYYVRAVPGLRIPFGLDYWTSTSYLETEAFLVRLSPSDPQLLLDGKTAPHHLLLVRGP